MSIFVKLKRVQLDKNRHLGHPLFFKEIVLGIYHLEPYISICLTKLSKSEN